MYPTRIGTNVVALCVFAVGLIGFAAPSDAQESDDSISNFHPRFVAEAPETASLLVSPTLAQQAQIYKDQIAPNWFGDDRFFWYRNSLPDSKLEYILVDTDSGERNDAFNHAALATQLNEHGYDDADAERLDLSRLSIDHESNLITFRFDEKSWSFDKETGTLSELDSLPFSTSSDDFLPNLRFARGSRMGGPETEIRFENRTEEVVELFWVEPERSRRSYGTLDPGQQYAQHTFVDHYWEVRNRDGDRVAIFRADQTYRLAVIGENNPPVSEPDRRASGGSERRGREPSRLARNPTAESPLRSPDESKEVFIQQGNLFIRPSSESDAAKISEQGTTDQPFGYVQWSPNGESLIAFQITPAETELVHLVESSPENGGRAQLHSRPYSLPGDPFTSYKLALLLPDATEVSLLNLDPIDFGRPRLHWYDDGIHFAYQHIDRGHQRLRVVEVNALTGETRTLIDEQSETFIWTTHFSRQSIPNVTWLEQSDELIYSSESSGFRHLYLVDATSDHPELTPITSGDFVVRTIERIDEELRQVWFTAGGYFEGQDPYLLHHFRVNFDGSELTPLTEGNGTHEISFSPTGRVFIDRYSRVDLPPIHELRRTSDGELICSLETTDVTELLASGWLPPEVFKAKGRDGETDIWGIICRPRSVDPNRQYPVIEDIYAGPHDSHVPKSFRARNYYETLTSLGFIVVKIDGMGTANRSKAFHDVCWQNLKDAGFPDRIAWHREVHEQYPYYDLERVGIYGVSAGGQNSTGGLLFHPEFYHVAVSACGCHDNRMDKSSWNEQWMGFPVGPHYAESSNIDNAHRLQGKLLLIVGELDTNVPPESTYRLVDALIQSNKDFDFLMIPNGGHGMGGRYGERKMREFFVEHLRPEASR